ncbi:hypothetical protein BC332_33414 [Capsicum chinense]|nr:hypothetical protein BC332_33414 [Capsicum chinense]
MEYPLVHYARLFGLSHCFAICLRSTHTGNYDDILEFFLPPNDDDYTDLFALLNSLLLTIKQHFRNLRVASRGKLEHDWRSVKIIKASQKEKLGSRFESMPTTKSLPHPVV